MTTQPKAFEALTELEQNKQASAAWRNAASNKTVLHRLLLSAAWLGMPSDAENIESRNVSCLKNFLDECANVHKTYVSKLTGYIEENFPYTVLKNGNLKFSVAKWEALGEDRQVIMDVCTGKAGTWWDFKRDKKPVEVDPRAKLEKLVQAADKALEKGTGDKDVSDALHSALDGYDEVMGGPSKSLAELLESVVSQAQARVLDDKEQALVAAVITALAAAR